LVPAASSTASVSSLRRAKICANSFTSAMFTSRCVFSIAFAASATRIDGARCVPAGMMRR
jgi:hypothetical protein